MAEWTHRICERCWFDGTPQRLVKVEEGQGVDILDGRGRVWEIVEQGEPLGVITEGEHKGAYKLPVQALGEDGQPEPGACCFCGGMTITGIYVRHDQDALLCRGRHDGEQLAEWSKVGA